MSVSTIRQSAEWRDYYELTKPKVVMLIVFTAIVGMFLATPGMVPWDVLIFGSLGIGLSAASGAVVMAAFGAGTLVSLSLVSALLQSVGMTRLPRQASGALLVLFAAWTALPCRSACQTCSRAGSRSMRTRGFPSSE